MGYTIIIDNTTTITIKTIQAINTNQNVSFYQILVVSFKSLNKKGHLPIFRDI